MHPPTASAAASGPGTLQYQECWAYKSSAPCLIYFFQPWQPSLLGCVQLPTYIKQNRRELISRMHFYTSSENGRVEKGTFLKLLKSEHVG